MRRIVFGMLVSLAVLALALVAGCQRDNALRIVAITPQGATFGDITDFSTWTDPEDPEPEPELIAFTTSDIVEIELQYVEIGLGLPTWTPYQAHIKRIDISYRDMSSVPPKVLEPQKVTINTDIVVPADVKGIKTSKATFPIVTGGWKEKNLEVAGDPTETGGDVTVKATIKISGTDDASGKQIEAQTDFTVNFSNRWDDPSRIGQ